MKLKTWNGTKEDQIKQKIPILKELYDIYGDYWLHANYKGKMWVNWLLFSNCSDNDLRESNLRQIMINEIVLDHDHTNPLDVRSKLIKEKYSFYTFSHDYPHVFGRNHFHLFFDKLAKLPERERTLAKKSMIKHFECDLMKAGDKTLIYCPFAIHGKTAQPKILVEEFINGIQQ